MHDSRLHLGRGMGMGRGTGTNSSPVDGSADSELLEFSVLMTTTGLILIS